MIHNIYGGFGEKEPRIFKETSPTIRTPKGGGHLPLVVADRTRTYAKKGRNLESPKPITNALSSVQKDNLLFLGGIDEPNFIKDGKKRSRNYSLGKRLYDSEGLATSLTSKSKGGQAGHTGIYKVGNIFPSKYETGDILNPKGLCKTLKRGIRDAQNTQVPKIAVTRFDVDDPHELQAESVGAITGQVAKRTLFGLSNGLRVRRLTPIECERLQGFPDGWTEGVSDTQRYKVLGNAVTVNVIEYLGKLLRGCLDG